MTIERWNWLTISLDLIILVSMCCACGRIGGYCCLCTLPQFCRLIVDLSFEKQLLNARKMNWMVQLAYFRSNLNSYLPSSTTRVQWTMPRPGGIVCIVLSSTRLLLKVAWTLSFNRAGTLSTESGMNQECWQDEIRRCQNKTYSTYSTHFIQHFIWY